MPQLPIDVDRFYTKKRARNQLRRRALFLRKQAKLRAFEAESLAKFGRRSKVLCMLSRAARKCIEPKRGKISVRVPEVFSIIDNPIVSVAVVLGFAAGLCFGGKRIREMYFDHSGMKKCDLAANALLDVVAVEFHSERRYRKAKLPKAKGVFPTDPALARFIRGVGIIKHLEVRHEAPKPADAQKLHVLDFRSRNYEVVSSKTLDKKSRVTKKFIDHVDQCLKRVGKELSGFGKVQLTGYLGEILSNAEEHAWLDRDERFVDWTVQGFLDDSLCAPVCEIAIFNFGRSIAESLSDVPRDGYTWKSHVAPYLEAHKNGFFGPHWREEDLMTVIALQGHVSRKNLTRDTSRGQGTVDLINFFQKVYKECNSVECCVPARMAIVSGGTYVLFDGTYEMKAEDGMGMVIAFNKQNSLMQKPDGKYVQNLGDLSFPGTIISIRFPLSLTDGSLVGEVPNGSANDH